MEGNECDKKEWRDFKAMRGAAWRIGASILTVTTWLSIGILWLFFKADDYSFWENLGLLIMSVLVLAATNFAIWVGFGMRYIPSRMKGRSAARTTAKAVTAIAWVSVLAYYLYTYAGSFTIYQNLAIFLAMIAIGGGVSAVLNIGAKDPVEA